MLALPLRGIQLQERLPLLTYRRLTPPVLGRSLRVIMLPIKSKSGAVVALEVRATLVKQVLEAVAVGTVR